MAKKIIKLTESQLIEVIGKIIKEQQAAPQKQGQQAPQQQTQKPQSNDKQKSLEILSFLSKGNKTFIIPSIPNMVFVLRSVVFNRNQNYPAITFDVFSIPVKENQSTMLFEYELYIWGVSVNNNQEYVASSKIDMAIVSNAAKELYSQIANAGKTPNNSGGAPELRINPQGAFNIYNYIFGVVPYATNRSTTDTSDDAISESIQFLINYGKASGVPNVIDTIKNYTIQFFSKGGESVGSQKDKVDNVKKIQNVLTSKYGVKFDTTKPVS